MGRKRIHIFSDTWNWNYVPSIFSSHLIHIELMSEKNGQWHCSAISYDNVTHEIKLTFSSMVFLPWDSILFPTPPFSLSLFVFINMTFQSCSTSQNSTIWFLPIHKKVNKFFNFNQFIWYNMDPSLLFKKKKGIIQNHQLSYRHLPIHME